jgi:hypothetical protein
VLLACAGLAVLTFALVLLMRKLGHRATAMVLTVLVTFDVAAFLILAVHRI